MQNSWEGIFCALWTPTNDDGHLNVDALRENMAFVRRAGVAGFLALASTGEFIYLDLPARKQLLDLAVSVASDLPVIANISDIRPDYVADLGRFAKKAGARAVALLPPYFYRFSQDELVEWFVRGAEAADLPLILYNFPELTGNKIDLETIDAVCQRVNVVGIKQSGGEFDYHRPLIQLGQKRDFVVFTGADIFLGDVVAMGGAGCIGGFANPIPDLMREVYLATRAGKTTDGGATDKIRTVWKIVDPLGFPLNVAATMEARGLTVGRSKPILSPRTVEKYREIVARLRENFQQWKLAPA